jgi:hypothetical protein
MTNLPTTLAIVQAIWQIEGGDHTRHPYGVMIHCRHPGLVCQNTVEHAKQDFLRYKPKVSFWDYLADRYVPEEADLVGHRNWVRFMKRRFK